MKPFARINLSSVWSSVALAKEEALVKEEYLTKEDALRRGILVSSLAFVGVARARSFHPTPISRIMV